MKNSLGIEMSRKTFTRNDADPILIISKGELAVDLLAFIITVIFAVVMKWEAGDLIWGFWTSSLCYGFAFVCVGFLSSVLHAEDMTQIYLILLGPFILAFYTFFLVIGHWILIFFLSGFFPLVEGQKMFANFFVTLSVALEAYWPIVLLTFVSRFCDLPFSGADFYGGTIPFHKPILSIYRIFLLILVLLGLYAINIENFAIFAVLFVYFVPWDKLRLVLQARLATYR
jgi:hypothetical protein